VLDFSKIDAGQLTLSPTPIDLRALIDNVLGVASNLAHEKGLFVRNTIDASLAAELIGDGVRLRQILFNLLSNATKFTEEGELGVRLQVLASEEGRQRIRLTVHDTGIGMTPEQQRRLFEPFAQADASIARRFGGTGLGLLICQRLVDLMDGTLAMHSAPGEGTAIAIEFSLPVHRQHLLSPPLLGCRAAIELTGEDAQALAGLLEPLGVAIGADGGQGALRFIDELSAAPAESTPRVVVTDEPSPLGYTLEADGSCMLSRNPFSWAAVEASCRHALSLATPAAEARAERMTGEPHEGLVLVAEDHPTNRELIRAQLQRLGYRSLVVAHGLEALEALHARGDIALLITDCDMPHMSGYALAANIRAHESADRHLPILALTASALPDEAERCSQAGMDALLVKPTGLGELQEALHRWMPAAAGKRRSKEAAGPAFSPIEALTELFGPSARLNELLDGFLATARDDLAVFDEALRAEDIQAIAGCIHRIDGAIKIFGATGLADTGEHIRTALLAQQRVDGQETPLQHYRQDLANLIDTLARHRAGLHTIEDHATH